MVEATRNRPGLMTPPSPPPVLNVRRHRIRPTLQPQKTPLNPWILRGPWNTDHRMRETGVYTRLFVGLVSPLAFLRLNPPLMALLGLVFCMLATKQADWGIYGFLDFTANLAILGNPLVNRVNPDFRRFGHVALA